MEHLKALSLLYLAFAIACTVEAQQTFCCQFGTWSKWSECGSIPSQGQTCDKAKRYQQCYLGAHPVSCFKPETCTHSLSCAGLWTTWAPNGPCNTQCGTGVQPAARNCYLIGSDPPFQSTSCAGAFGANVQTRNDICVNKIGCRLTTTPIPTRIRTRSPQFTTTTPTTPTTTQTTSSKATITSSKVGITSKFPPTSPTTLSSSSSTSTNVIGKTDSVQQPLDYTLLAAILGSVLLLCIAIVVIAVVITRRRKRHNDTNAPAGRRLPTSADRMYYRESGNYEEAGPPLPDRPSLLHNKELVDNSLYETIDPKNVDRPVVEEEYDSGYQVASDFHTNGNGYLQPFNSGPPVIPESVYLSLERNGGSRV